MDSVAVSLSGGGAEGAHRRVANKGGGAVRGGEKRRVFFAYIYYIIKGVLKEATTFAERV